MTRSSPRRGERGQAIILIIFALIGLIGASALAIDGTNAFIDRRRAESAASAAALTAALTRIEGGNWRAAALAVAATNGYNNDGASNIVEINTPPLEGAYKNDSQYIEVKITSNLRTYFGVVIGIPTVTSSAQAIAQSKPSEMGEMFPGYAMVSLATKSECDRDRQLFGFRVYSEATVNLTGGGLFVNSANPTCAFTSYGSGSVRVAGNDRISVVGGADIQKPRLITPYPIETNIPPIPYPPPYQFPKIGCSQEAVADYKTGVMQAGYWDEDIFPPPEITTLESGVYCLKGDFYLDDGQLEGTGVLFVVKNGSVFLGSHAHLDLSAPKSGANKGLLFYMPLENTRTITLNATSDSNLVGTILAPRAALHLYGPHVNTAATYYSKIVAYTIDVNGDNNIRIAYKPEQNWETLTMPEVILIK